jgi:hypothetical protein
LSPIHGADDFINHRSCLAFEYQAEKRKQMRGSVGSRLVDAFWFFAPNLSCSSPEESGQVSHAMKDTQDHHRILTHLVENKVIRKSQN